MASPPGSAPLSDKPVNSANNAAANFTVESSGETTTMTFSGDWTGDAGLPDFAELRSACPTTAPSCLKLVADNSLLWDSNLQSRLFLLARHCEEQQIPLDTSALPDAMQKLLSLASSVKTEPSALIAAPGFFASLADSWRGIVKAGMDFVTFIGELIIALLRFCTGRSQTRIRDLFYFIEQCGPKALGIVALISVLVGMILAYLGSVQLRQFGAEVYVANLVALGMVREMGPLMTAVIMSGRTGAAYAAQLGTMQANEEIDAVTTLGLSPTEYLVVPRFLALVLVMPLLVIFANLVGLVGGALVAAGMDVNFTQFISQARSAVTLTDIATGLFKSLVFAGLIAVAGCQAGLQSSRSSAGVGNATTSAVVHAIVYLVVADAALNIIYNLLQV